MTSIHKFAAATAAIFALGACAHRGVDNVSAGDIAIDSLSATRTAVLRVDNASSQVVRVYMDMPGMKPQYVAKAMPGQARSWVLDPQMFPAGSVTFEARPENGATLTTGSYRVNKNETVDLTIAPSADRVRAMVHKSTP